MTTSRPISHRPALSRKPAAEAGSRDARPPRVLYFATRACWPPDTGASLRNFHLVRELARGARVTYLAFADPRRPNSDAGEEDRRSYNMEVERACERVITVPRASAYTPAKMVRGTVGPLPLPVLNYTTGRMRRTLGHLLAEQEFDLIQIESLHLLGYLPILQAAASRPRLLWDWHNVESEVLRRYSECIESRPRRLYARLTAVRMEALERRAMPAFAAHTVVSERDRVRLLTWHPDARVFVIENGVDVARYSSEACRQARAVAGGRRRAPADCRRLLFVGSMDYHANVDAVVTFARDVWPRLRRTHPNLVFTIVGRNPAPRVCALARQDGIEVTGTVADVRPYYADAVAAAVPLRVGGGSRLKILEAMAAGVPVISTPLGAEGLPVSDGENILLADTPEEFCSALAHVCRNDAVRQALTRRAEALVRGRYDWSAIGSALRDVHRELTRSAESAAVGA
jgi:sugar transferase (PEP-CTERM/EpsH1 system associated)